nr:MAG TPA: hypothetical protein [Caudoviricetes sp.]
MVPTIGPNRYLTVRGRRSMPALGLGWYSADVSVCGYWTSQHVVALGHRACIGVASGVD